MCDNDVKIYKKSDDTVSFARIALALASDYNSVYLISTKDDSYIEYSISPEDRTLTKASWGDDFYADVIPNSQALVYHEDLKYFQSTFRKENVIAALENGKSFSLQYRLVIDNKPQYYYLKTIFDSSSASEFIVIGVQNVDAQVRRLKAVEAENETYSFISRALASRYEVIYYVDTETNEYLEYSSSEDYSKLGTKKNGRDFFKTAASDINKFVYHEDRRHLLYSIDKGVMMKNLETSGFLSYTYRQTLNDRLQYVRMVVVRPYKGSKNIVIGVQNVDDQVRREQVMAEESATFGEIIRALAMRYEVIYYVNTITDDFKEYTSSEKYAKLNIGDTGTDFFGETQRNLKRDIYPEDYPMMAESMTKTTLLKNISETGSTSLNYRLILDGRPQYVTLFAIRPKEDSEHIIIAVANVDAAKRRENGTVVVWDLVDHFEQKSEAKNKLEKLRRSGLQNCVMYWTKPCQCNIPVIVVAQFLMLQGVEEADAKSFFNDFFSSESEEYAKCCGAGNVKRPMVEGRVRTLKEAACIQFDLEYEEEDENSEVNTDEESSDDGE